MGIGFAEILGDKAQQAIANQENINKYCYSNQKNTFLDIDYSEFESLQIPKDLNETIDLKLSSDLNRFMYCETGPNP